MIFDCRDCGPLDRRGKNECSLGAQKFTEGARWVNERKRGAIAAARLEGYNEAKEQAAKVVKGFDLIMIIPPTNATDRDAYVGNAQIEVAAHVSDMQPEAK